MTPGCAATPLAQEEVAPATERGASIPPILPTVVGPALMHVTVFDVVAPASAGTPVKPTLKSDTAPISDAIVFSLFTLPPSRHFGVLIRRRHSVQPRTLRTTGIHSHVTNCHSYPQVIAGILVPPQSRPVQRRRSEVMRLWSFENALAHHISGLARDRGEPRQLVLRRRGDEVAGQERERGREVNVLALHRRKW